MANKEHLDILKQGGKIWNRWRDTSQESDPDLSGAKLEEADFRNLDLHGVNLMGANLKRANFHWADLSGANLRKANVKAADFQDASATEINLSWANLQDACLKNTNLQGADISWANLKDATLREADAREADFRNADLRFANLYKANLRKADFREAYLSNADFIEANLEGANLGQADLRGAHFFKANLKDTNLSGCHIYGISAWELNIDEATCQHNLIITDWDAPTISVDDFHVAQFFYFLLHSSKLPQIFETVSTRFVLILGRFSPERQEMLDMLRRQLRQHQMMPVLLDFQKPDVQKFSLLISTLAQQVRFVIADVSTFSTPVLKAAELLLTAAPLPFLPLLSDDVNEEPDRLALLRARYSTVLDTVRYTQPEELAFSFEQRILTPASVLSTRD